MILRACFLFLAVFAITAQCDIFRDFRIPDPFEELNTRRLVSQSQSAYGGRDVEEVTERDREPLDPNYKDPGSKKETPGKEKPQKPSYDSSVIPGGVIDVDAGTTGIGGGFGGLGAGLGGFTPFGSAVGGSSLFGLGGLFGGVGEFKPWWKGPNVCIEREESNEGGDKKDQESAKNETEEIPNFFQATISLSNCQQTPKKYECTTKINNHGVIKTFTVRYKCCYGYERTRDGEGCNKKLELKPLMDTVDDLKANEFKNFITNAGLEEKFNEGNYTIFAPTDNSLHEYTEKMVQLNDLDTQPERSRRQRNMKNAPTAKDLVLSHTVEGFLDLSELDNEDVVNSENNNSTIRINTYPTQNYGRMMTVNCAKVTKMNNFAKNGIVHVIEGVATPATQSIEQILMEHPSLGYLRQAMETTDLMKTFQSDGHYTVFAPTNEAFNKLNEKTKQKILKGDGCAKNIVRYHITGNTVCSSAITANSTTFNIDGEPLDLDRTNEDELILEDKAKIIETDIIATNGVIHLIDNVIIPESALHINEALNNLNMTKFYNLIEKAGLTEEMNNLKNSTLFAPSDEAFNDEKTQKYLEDIENNKEKLKELIEYHTVKGQLESDDMHNNLMLKTHAGDDKKLRLNLYSTLPLLSYVINKATVNCAKLTGFDQKSCGSVIHEVNKVLIPPTKTILEVIENDSQYSILGEIVKGTEVEEILKNPDESLTLLAPTDETFKSLDDKDLKTLKEDKEKANDLLKNHILNEVLCCSGVGPQTWGFNSLVKTLSNQNHQVGRTGNHQIRIDRAVVTNCDNVAKNGVVHTINNVLFPIKRRNPTTFGGLFLLNF